MASTKTVSFSLACALVALAAIQLKSTEYHVEHNTLSQKLDDNYKSACEWTADSIRTLKAQMLKVMSWMLGKRLRLTGYAADIFKLELVDHDDLQPGDQIAVFINYNDVLSFLHHGIYIGNSTVIDVNNTGVHNITLTDFYGKEPLFRVTYHVWVRQRPPGDVIKAALHFYEHPGEREEFSMTFGWNCETFATYCKTGVNATAQYADLVLTWVKTFLNPLYETTLKLTRERYRGVFSRSADCQEGGGQDGTSSHSSCDDTTHSSPDYSIISALVSYLCPHPMFLN